jgi:hypothetical protein
MIEDNVPTDTLISLEPAGNIPYFAQDHRFVDALGKNDAHIARLPAHSGNTLIGHNKFDWDYIYRERQPELVLASCVLPDIWIPLSPEYHPEIYSEAGTNGLSYLPYQLLHEDFVDLYYPNRVFYLTPSPTSDWILCPFARSGSDLQLAWVLPGTLQDSLWMDFDVPIQGQGWYPPDVWEDGRTVQWTGPQTNSRLYLPFAPSSPYILEMCIIPIREELRNGLEILINNVKMGLQVHANSNCEGDNYIIEGIPVDQDFLTLDISVAATIIPDLFTGNDDTRRLGFAFDWLSAGYR